VTSPEKNEKGNESAGSFREGNDDMQVRSDESVGATRRLQAREMLGPKGVVQIEHEGEIYTLRLTRNNRLILTK